MKTISRIAAISTVILATGVAGMASAERGGHSGRGMPMDFTAIDSNADGALDRAELTDQATARLAVIDVDGDGNLTLTELADSFPERGGAMMNLFGPDRSERMANRILALHGATEAGQVSVSDVVERQVNELFARIDGNSDSSISQDEMDQMAGMHRGGGHGRHHGGDRDHDRMDRRGSQDGPRNAPGDAPAPDEDAQ